MRRFGAIVFAACGAAVPPVPGQGGPAWVELTSQHFTLWTDASLSRGRELVAEMEHLRQVIFGVAFADLPDAGRSFVIALRDADEAGAYVPEQFIAFASPPTNNPIHQPFIVLSADTSEERHVVTHELTHVISFGAIHAQPHWFAEGLARYFETVRLDPKRATVDVGEPTESILRSLRTQRLIPVASLFTCERFGCMDDAFYTTAWAVFSYLTNERAAQLGRFEQRLDELGPRAWAEVFADLPPGKLDGELRQWLVHGKHRVLHFNVQLRSWPITERQLGDGDVYAARALMRYLFSPKDAQNKLDIAAALRADPTNVLANLMSEAQDGTPIANARTLAAAHPDDWRAWWLTVREHPDDAEARARACELIAANPALVPPGGLCRSAAR